MAQPIRDCRLLAGLLQAKVAELPCMSVLVIVNWEKNHTDPNVRDTPKLIGCLCPVLTFGFRGPSVEYPHRQRLQLRLTICMEGERHVS